MDKDLINSVKDLTAAVMVNSILQAALLRNQKADISSEEYKELVTLVQKMWKTARNDLVP